MKTLRYEFGNGVVEIVDRVLPIHFLGSTDNEMMGWGWTKIVRSGGLLPMKI